MKKFGFTLAEIVVSLAIIGIIASITAPIVSNMIPDKNKVQVIKVHKILTDINKELLNDPSLYYKQPTPPGDPHLKGLNQTGRVLREPLLLNQDLYQGKSKYIALLAGEYMKTDAMSPPVIAQDSDNGSFVTIDGIEWVFTGFNFYIDLNENGENCSYNSSSCLRPDRFNFIIDPDTGNITGGDPLTRAYLANPENLNDKKADYKTAKNE